MVTSKEALRKAEKYLEYSELTLKSLNAKDKWSPTHSLAETELGKAYIELAKVLNDIEKEKNK
jgi:hypothetical protein